MKSAKIKLHPERITLQKPCSGKWRTKKRPPISRKALDIFGSSGRTRTAGLVTINYPAGYSLSLIVANFIHQLIDYFLLYHFSLHFASGL